MEFRLLEALRCPYCAGGFQVTRRSEATDQRLRYGLIECRCFSFPVVDGILLLSLAKGYGGAEEAVQPYVPLQVAAIRHLERDDVAGLKGWIGRHTPLVASLLAPDQTPYLAAAARLERAVKYEAERELLRVGPTRVLGYGGRRERFERRKQRLLGWRPWARPVVEASGLASYYATRFFSPRVSALALHLASWPLQGRVLSLCCGHGMFENLLRADGRPHQRVSIDGQLVNLLIARRYAESGGDYICHDLQFPLPFTEGYFDGVFSSSCLPEIPSQQGFIREAIRVTADTGWTVFDSIWNLEMRVRRIEPWRHYRYCQNFFTRLDDYLPLVTGCAGDREVGVDVSGAPDRYRQGATWTFGAAGAMALAARDDVLISLIVIDRERFHGFVAPQYPWLTSARLSVSPVYAVETQGDRLLLRRHDAFEAPGIDFAQHSFAGYAEQMTLDRHALAEHRDTLVHHYCEGNLVLLPENFASRQQRLVDMAPVLP